jgi:DNA topoisomerase IB
METIMKIRVVSSKEEIKSLEPSEKFIHLAFRPSNTDIFSLVQTCPDVKAIQVPPSYIKKVSIFNMMLLDMKGIALLEGDVWGHRTEINEYYEIKPELFDQMKELKKEGLSENDILNKLRREGLSNDLLKFLLKGKAKR